MDRCHQKGAQGDAIHAVLCAVRYNIRWLLRMIVRGLGLLLRLLQTAVFTELISKLNEIIDTSTRTDCKTQICGGRWLEMNFAWTTIYA